MNRQQFVQAVKKYALEHYNEDGWDYCVETMDDATILEDLNQPFFRSGLTVQTEAEAIERIGEICRLLNERRRDIQATADDWL